jgi:hypothetical protein
MKLSVAAVLVLLAATSILGVLPAAGASPIVCPPGEHGIWFRYTSPGPIGVCCKLATDPVPPCAVSPDPR